MTTTTGRRSRRRTVAEVVAGAGLALTGHLMAVVVAYAAGRWAAGGRSADELDAGGGFALLFVMAVAFCGAQLFLLCVCGVAAGVGAANHGRFSAGVAAGWLAGVVAVAAMIVILYIYLDYQSPYY